MSLNWTCSSRLKSLIGSIFLNSTIHPYANLFLYLLQYFEIVGVFLGRSEIQQLKNQDKNDGTVGFMLWAVFVIHIGIFGMVAMVLLYGNEKAEGRRKNNGMEEFDVKFESWGLRLLRRTLAITLTVYRRTLLIPTLTLINITHTSTNQFLPISTLILLSIIYLISLTIYFNRLVTRDNILSYPFWISIESVWVMVVPVIVVLNGQNNVDSLKWVGGVVMVLMVGVGWLRPVVSYRGNRGTVCGCGLVWGAVGVQLGRLMLGGGGDDTVQVGSVITYVCVSLMVAFLIIQLSEYRSKVILISPTKADNSKLHHKLTRTLNSFSYPQLLFYHLINYNTHKQSLILWILKLKQQQTETTDTTFKSKTEITCKSKSEITYQNKSQNTSKNKSENSQKKLEIINKANEIIGILKEKDLEDDKLREKFFQILENVLAEIYQPKEMIGENMGRQELEAGLEGVSNLFYLGAQLLFLQPRQSIRKCYSYLKSHDQLTKRTDFFSSIFTELLIEEMDQITKQSRKLSNQYSLKAQQYFIFERGFQVLRQEVGQVGSLRDQFWKQSMLKQTDNTKLQALIQNSYKLQHSVQRRCQSLSRTFNSQKSPLILYSLISSYSKLILNKTISSKQSSFYYLNKQYNEKLEKLNKEGGEKLTQTNSKNLKKFSLLENVAVCLVDLESERGRIEWGNTWFWEEVYKKNSMRGAALRIDGMNRNGGSESSNEEGYQKDKKQKPNIEDLILPQLRQVHKKYIQNFTFTSSQLQVLHLKQIFLYNSEQKTICFPQIHIQLYPSLVEGLKTCCYFTNIKIKKQDNIGNARFSLLIDGESWEVVGWTEGFEEWKDLLIGQESYWQDETKGKVDGTRGALGQLRQVIDKMVNRKIKTELNQSLSHQNNQKDEINIVENQSLKQPNSVFKQNHLSDKNPREKPLRVLIEQQAFSINLTQLYNTPQPHFTLEFCQQSQLQSPQPTANSMVSKPQFPVITMTEESSHKQARYNEQNTSGSLYYCNSFRGVAQCKEEQEPTEVDQKKSEDFAGIEKQYNVLIGGNNQIPKAIKLWIGATVVIVILLSFAIAGNIYTLNSRQQLYKTTGLSIKYFNSLITDITQLIIALRQYNYFAFTNGPQDPHIPFLINQVSEQEEQVNFKLNQVKEYLNEEWQAIQINRNNTYRKVLQKDYIVIANYMLSAMTYISEIPPSEMTFPIFWGDHPKEKDLTPAQINFFEAIYNGIYVVIQNLNRRKFIFLDEILKKITEWNTKVYLYSCAAGVLVLGIFLAISIFVEKQANSVRQRAIQLLSQVNFLEKKGKIEKIAEFCQRNNFKEVKSEEQLREEGMTHLQKTLTTLNISNGMIKKETVLSFLISAEKQFTNPETDRQTKRQLKEDSDHVLGAKDGPSITELEEANERVLIKIPQKRRSLMFYILLSTPAIAYFLTMLLSGLSMDFQTAKRLEMGSQIYIKKSNIELVLLLTRRTFYYEAFIINNPQKWSSKGISVIQDVFWHSRKLDLMIQEYGGNGELKKLINTINYKSLCDHLSNFPQSPYYEVTFSKQQCQQFTNGVMLNGIKSTEAFYFESSLNLLTQIQNPILLTKQQRYDYIKGSQLKGMKFMLAYLEEFMDMIKRAFWVDLQKEIDSFVKRVDVLSGVALVAVMVLLVGVKVRWRKIRRDKRFVTEIVEIISLRTIKNSSRLRNQWKNVGVGFYE